MIAELRARAWQFGTFAASAVAVSLAVGLTVTTLQRNAAVKRADGLHAEIHEPVTGYIAQKARCEANVRELERAAERQNEAIDGLRRLSAAQLQQAETRLAAAQRAAADARLRAERLTKTTLTATTRCERMEEADAAVLEILR